MNKIVVGVDGSATADRALQWALAEAKQRGAQLVAVHAWHIPPLVYADPRGVAMIDRDVLAAGAADTLREALGRADVSGLTPAVESVVKEGPSGAAILEAAHDAELIVVGSRGQGELTQLFLGSVSQHVLHHAHIPVVVVPPI